MSWAQDDVRDDLVRGVAAAKAGDEWEAREYLERVLRSEPDTDSRVQALLWLSQLEQDSARRRGYLEDVLARDPTNVLARRGMAILDGRLRPEEIVDPERVAEAPAPTAPEDVTPRRFVCHNCGGSMGFDPQRQRLVCQYCGATMTHVDARLADPMPASEGDFITTMAKEEGHRWHQSGYSVKCEGCGATTLLPAGQISSECPFCGSPQVVRTELRGDVIEPHGIIRFRLGEREAAERFRAWLGNSMFRPSDLARQATSGRPRGVYVPFWVFDAIGTANWSAQVYEGSGRAGMWVARSGEISVIEDHVMVPASHTLPAGPLRALDQFDLGALEPYHAEKIADWPAEIYQIPLADASIVAREKIASGVRLKVEREALGGDAHRSLRTSLPKIGIDQFQHVLLPVWVCSYQYGGKVYYVLVNGQTGEVEGEAPTAWGAVALLALLGVAVFVVCGLLIYLMAT